ncbi:hypothetical protein ElyMa_000713900 [Elysia marginata]|uniref:Secreted protein n=1 Tax=Elysia marginata TaxID=1093978 RepID=A0AAV4GK96_9GAST|nr:hypothetical protein ElyMa_000713900 [Elysia marginata]
MCVVVVVMVVVVVVVVAAAAAVMMKEDIIVESRRILLPAPSVRHNYSVRSASMDGRGSAFTRPVTAITHPDRPG